jgi:hypothetical protein
MSKFTPSVADSLEAVLEADKEARKQALQVIKDLVN